MGWAAVNSGTPLTPFLHHEPIQLCQVHASGDATDAKVTSNNHRLTATDSQTSRFAQMDASLDSQLAWDSSTLAGAADASFDQLLESLGPLFATWSIAGRRPSP